MTRIGGRPRRVFLTPFGLAVLGCLVFAGWALWSGGILNDPVAAKVRSSSVYAAPGTGLDSTAAERIIGNRRLVVILLNPGADLGAACDSVRHAAAGTLVAIVSRNGDRFDSYGCSLFARHGNGDLGTAMAVEQMIGRGVDQFVDRPLDAVKVIAVNYDMLVKAKIIPADARTVSPSLPRFVIAVAAVIAVVLGATLLYAVAWRSSRLAAARRARRDQATDSRTVLSAATAAVAQQIIDLDPTYALAVVSTRRSPDAMAHRSVGRSRTSPRPAADDSEAFVAQYAQLTSEYTRLLDDIAAADRRGEADFTRLTARAEALASSFRACSASPAHPFAAPDVT